MKKIFSHYECCRTSYEKNIIDFMLKMSKVFLHNLITMSTIEQLLYIYNLNCGILTDIQFKLQAILNKCQNKSLKLIVNYTSTPTPSIKRAMNARKLHKQLSVNWKALKPPPTSFIKLQTSFNFDRNHFTEIFSLFSCLNLWLKSRCNLHDYVHLLRRYLWL